MKSYKLGLVFGVALLMLWGCEKRDPAETALGDEATLGQAVTMQLWTTEEPRFFEALTKEFIAELAVPNLRFKVISFDSEKELQAYAVDKMAEGEGPDIIFTNGEWIAQNTGKLVPVGEADEGFNETNFRNTFVQSASELLIQEEKIYGIPLAIDTLALIFNEEHIEDRLPEANTPSRNWRDFRQDVENITKADNSFERFSASGAALGRMDNTNHGGALLETIMVQMGIQFFDENGTQALFNQSQSVEEGGRRQNLGVEAFNFYTSFADDRFKNHSWNDLLADSGSNLKDFETFARGKTSMVFAYARDLKKIDEIIESLEGRQEKVINAKDLRVSFLPQIQDPSVSADRRIVAKVSALGVSRTTEYPNTAWQFLKYAIKKDNLQKFHEETSLPTPRVDMLAQQESMPEVGVYVRQAKFARANKLPLPKAEFYEALAPIILDINDRKLTLEKGINLLANRLTQRLKTLQAKRKEMGD